MVHSIISKHRDEGPWSKKLRNRTAHALEEITQSLHAQHHTRQSLGRRAHLVQLLKDSLLALDVLQDTQQHDLQDAQHQLRQLLRNTKEQAASSRYRPFSARAAPQQPSEAAETKVLRSKLRVYRQRLERCTSALQDAKATIVHMELQTAQAQTRSMTTGDSAEAAEYKSRCTEKDQTIQALQQQLQHLMEQAALNKQMHEQEVRTLREELSQTTSGTSDVKAGRRHTFEGLSSYSLPTVHSSPSSPCVGNRRSTSPVLHPNQLRALAGPAAHTICALPALHSSASAWSISHHQNHRGSFLRAEPGVNPERSRSPKRERSRAPGMEVLHTGCPPTPFSLRPGHLKAYAAQGGVDSVTIQALNSSACITHVRPKAGQKPAALLQLESSKLLEAYLHHPPTQPRASTASPYLSRVPEGAPPTPAVAAAAAATSKPAVKAPTKAPQAAQAARVPGKAVSRQSRAGGPQAAAKQKPVPIKATTTTTAAAVPRVRGHPPHQASSQLGAQASAPEDHEHAVQPSYEGNAAAASGELHSRPSAGATSYSDDHHADEYTLDADDHQDLLQQQSIEV